MTDTSTDTPYVSTEARRQLSRLQRDRELAEQWLTEEQERLTLQLTIVDKIPTAFARLTREAQAQRRGIRQMQSKFSDGIRLADHWPLNGGLGITTSSWLKFWAEVETSERRIWMREDGRLVENVVHYKLIAANNIIGITTTLDLSTLTADRLRRLATSL